MTQSDAIQRQVFRDARELTVLDGETQALKAFYENKLLQEYTEEEFNQ